MGSEHFRYIKSKCNPADASPEELHPVTSKAGCQDHRFSNFPETEWPQFQDDDHNFHQERQHTLKEMKIATTPEQVGKRDTTTRKTHAFAVPEEKDDNPIFCYLLQRCSTFTKIRRVLAYVHRFVEVTRRKAVTKGSLTVQEVENYSF